MTLFDDTESGERAAPMEPLCRVRMTVAYDGSPFKGFARQAGVKTVAGTLEEAIAKVVRHEVQLTCAGRTDSGVHAWGQVVHFDSPLAEADLDLPGLQRALNRMLRPAVSVREIGVATGGFDARRSALARRYRYTVYNSRVPNPFLAAIAWHVEEPLDFRALELAADPFIGEHDFAAFCKKPDDPNASTVRRVLDARWLDLGEGVLRFDIEATSFCHNMVRSIVGTVVDAGVGRKRAGDMAWIIRSRDRQNAGPVAPPHGLCLWEVVYPDSAGSP